MIGGFPLSTNHIKLKFMEVNPGAAQSRQGGTAEETAAAGESTGIGGVTP